MSLKILADDIVPTPTEERGKYSNDNRLAKLVCFYPRTIFNIYV